MTAQWHPVTDETDTTPAGIRLSNRLWADLDREADRLGITRNDLIARLLERAATGFQRVPALPGFA